MRSMIRKYVETEDIHPDYVVMVETEKGMVLASVNPLDKDKNHAIATARKLLWHHPGFGSVIKREVLFKVKMSESGLPVWEEVKEKSADKPQKSEDKPKPLTIWDMVAAIKDRFNITPKSVRESDFTSTAVYQSFEVRHYPKNPSGDFCYHFHDVNFGSSGDIEYVLNSLAKRLKTVPTSDGSSEAIWDAIFAIKEKFGIVPTLAKFGSGTSEAEYEMFSINKKHGCFYQLIVDRYECPWNVPSVGDVLKVIKTLNLAGE